jgi:hypothetical protein
MSLDQQIELTDKEIDPVRRYAELHGITEEEAASKLFKEAFAKRYRKAFNKAPATVYQLRSKQ